MIAFLRGTVVERGPGLVILDAGGVGYEVHLTPSAASALRPGGPAELFVSETTALYGGGTTLYGFPRREEKELFLALRDHVPSTGAKKALEYLEKASRSLPEFRRAVLEGDLGLLSAVFGFTRKTAEKLLAGLKDKLDGGLPGESSPRGSPSGAFGQALDALATLGYKPAECRAALDAVQRELGARPAEVEELLRRSLKSLSARSP